MSILSIKYLRQKLIVCLLLIAFVLSVFVGCANGNNETSSATEQGTSSTAPVSSNTESSVVSEESEETSSEVSEEESSEVVSEEESSFPEVSEEESSVPEESEEDSSVESSKEESSEVTNPNVSNAKGWRPSPFDYGYPTPENIENNIFWDSLEYTGYNMQKHIDDGLMWEYILAGYKREKGWLSDIGYAGGSLGYEVTEEGLPDIEFFERRGLVCASYLAYVYFNYLPNVCGIDTSCLEKPTLAYSANDWYLACQKWVEDGYSRTIDFKATKSHGFIKYEPAEEIPIGSILCFRDITNTTSNFCRHVCIYAGYKNGYHWVYHVGNDNGPEFCAVERMSFGEGAQWPTAIFTTPDFVLEAMNNQ